MHSTAVEVYSLLNLRLLVKKIYALKLINMILNMY